MSLEFYQKKKSRWPFSDECIPWEVWTVKVHVVALATEQEAAGGENKDSQEA